MRDQLDRDRRHEILEPSLGDEAFGKARTKKLVAYAQAEPACYHDPARPLSQREVARDAAERQAETIRRCGGGLDQRRVRGLSSSSPS